MVLTLTLKVMNATILFMFSFYIFFLIMMAGEARHVTDAHHNRTLPARTAGF